MVQLCDELLWHYLGAVVMKKKKDLTPKEGQIYGWAWLCPQIDMWLTQSDSRK